MPDTLAFGSPEARVVPRAEGLIFAAQIERCCAFVSCGMFAARRAKHQNSGISSYIVYKSTSTIYDKISFARGYICTRNSLVRRYVFNIRPHPIMGRDGEYKIPFPFLRFAPCLGMGRLKTVRLVMYSVRCSTREGVWGRGCYQKVDRKRRIIRKVIIKSLCSRKMTNDTPGY